MVSTVKVLLVLLLVLLLVSVWVTVMVWLPWPMLVTSLSVTAICHLPSEPTTAVLPRARVLLGLKEMVTVAPYSPWPVMYNEPELASALLMMSSVVTVMVLGAAGGVLSMVMTSVVPWLRLPAASTV